MACCNLKVDAIIVSYFVVCESVLGLLLIVSANYASRHGVIIEFGPTCGCLPGPMLQVFAILIFKLQRQVFRCFSTHLHQQDDITCQADFLARHLHTVECDIVANNDFVVRFNVYWCHPLQLKDEFKQPSECPKISTDIQVHEVRRTVRSLLEVYTVMVHHDTNKELKICGKMLVCDNWTGFLYFDRKMLNPVILSGNVETIPINVKRRCLNLSEYLAMGIRLKDVEGRVLIEGEISWNDYKAKEPISWYDKRICSVIRGKHGYAAVFYSIFSKARQAEVKISFECAEYPDVRYSLDGSIVAGHSKGTYLTEYDKACYQSVLFRGNSSDLQSGCTVPLSKSVVAVPIDAFLTVVINLYASPLSPELPKEHLTSNVTFNMVPDVKPIKEGNCIIKVCLEWSDFPKLISEERNSSLSDSE
ncbi:uncharacterized protein LOC141638954 [Silene latifolia]|uniref:uncharacterized protein LOC141638954 n=1 Tax=Silene latifolia TaxID=37657 RepID=UPI003D77E8B2